MAYQAVFKRYELKYMITVEQKQRLLQAMKPHMLPDKYPKATIRNIYFDTDSYRLIRRSIEKPAYKEKLRIRSYKAVSADEPVFVELKKKYRGVVYKRRLTMPQKQAMEWIAAKAHPPRDTQIAREIDYFISYYRPLHPTVFLSYDREAYCCRRGSDLRVTFDENILCRREGLSLEQSTGGEALLPPGKVLMEIKISGGIPLWLTHVLTEQSIFKASFSKYGTAYERLIIPDLKGGYLHV